MGQEKRLVLVVDDEVHILHVVSLKLRNAGYEVVTAENGQEALELALARRPDMVITDFQMPLMSGLELCQRFKEEPSTNTLPVLMLTARGFSLSAEDLDKTNIAGVLSKPFSPREVLARVQDLIGGQVDQEKELAP
jgi:CheY-like chemotaxis protein